MENLAWMSLWDNSSAQMHGAFASQPSVSFRSKRRDLTRRATELSGCDVSFPPAAGVHVSGVGERLQLRNVVAGQCDAAGSDQTIDMTGLGDADYRCGALGDGPRCGDIGSRRTLIPAE